MDDYPPLSLAENVVFIRLFRAIYPGSTINPSNNNLILRPSKPASPGVDVLGVKAGFWNKDLKPSKHPKASEKKEITSKAQGKRAVKYAEDEAAKAEARKKGKTAYFAVNIIRGTTRRFQWKDKKGIIWSVDDVTFKPGWDLDRAEFEAKLAYDTYWGSESEQYIQASGNPSNTDSLTAKVAWTAAAKFPEKVVADHALAKFLNGITTRKFEEPHPTHVPGSISEFARNIVETNEKEWPGVVQAWKEKRNGPDAFAVNIKKHKEAFRKLMEHAVSRIDLAIATHVSLVEAVTAYDGRPQGNGPQGNGDHELPQYIDPGLTQEHVLSDIHVLPYRLAGQHATKHTQLTFHEKVMLFLVFQQLRDTANPPYRLTEKQTQLEVATLNQDHPPSIARQRSDDVARGNGRKKADKVSLGLSLNYEAGSVLWTWYDSQKKGVSHHASVSNSTTKISLWHVATRLDGGTHFALASKCVFFNLTLSITGIITDNAPPTAFTSSSSILCDIRPIKVLSNGTLESTLNRESQITQPTAFTRSLPSWSPRRGKKLFSDFATFEKKERKLLPDLTAFRYRKELPACDERQTLSSRGLSDSDELTEDIVSSDIHVASFRNPASFVDTHALLTAREKDIVFVMLQPIRKTAEPPYRITYGYWNGILKKLFDDWNTKLQAPADPILTPPPPIKEHTYITGGTLKSDQPLPNSKRRACRTVLEDFRTRGAEARIGVYINPDTNSISFPWTDTKGNAVSDSNVTLMNNRTEVDLRREAIEQYDILDLLQHVHGNKGFGVPGLDDPTNEPAVAPITQYDNPAPDEYKKAPRFQSEAGQTSWQADNAACRVSKACSDKAVARVLPWKREFANLQRVIDAEPAVTQTEGHSLASNVNMAAMAHHLDAFRARQFENLGLTSRSMLCLMMRNQATKVAMRELMMVSAGKGTDAML
ncbi:uncharacterized protein FTJAE_9653 [Fusarium tjaetaba]|uniref:Uncharacterized protein n=1 Tax=Fusarium tjaetaba TaxID=1567544 RepID=A0A8H5R4V0_9HYPO|nr:uncharacterized protein FTJAE_9653 [Fusarium tjaetaba]KAF5626488.1 hypothetical protein FTJAE_9653 [Fusarium tjaetaba]